MNFCPQAVIFDMDGLLVDSEPVWHIAESQVVEARGKVLTPEIREQLVGLRMDDFALKLRRLCELEDGPQVLINEIVGNMIDLIPTQVYARPGADELIAYLRARGIPCAIASSSPMSIIETTVRSRGWADDLPLRVSGDEVARGKPAPDVYLETARRMGFDPSVCLALEDSPNGARAAVAAGMMTYVVPDLSHSTFATFADITPHVFASLHEVQAALDGCAFS